MSESLAVSEEATVTTMINQMLRQDFRMSIDGCLFVGSSESLGSRSALFETLDKTWRIFRSRSEGRQVALKFPAVSTLSKTLMEQRQPPTAPLIRSVAERVHRGLSDAFVPPTVAVSYTHEVRYFHGAVARYLEFPGGEPLLLVSFDKDAAISGRSTILPCMSSIPISPNMRKWFSSG